jgi:hypothetical protein
VGQFDFSFAPSANKVNLALTDSGNRHGRFGFFSAEAEMNKSDKYRAQAEECLSMARKAVNPDDKATWLKMAEDWLRLIRPPRQSASDKFDAAEKAQGTHQKKSDAEH